MALSIRCPSCAKTLKAPDSAAGKKAKCPACGTVLSVPKPEAVGVPVAGETTLPSAPRPVFDDDFAPSDGSVYSVAPESPLPAASPRRHPCPQCGESIPDQAAKCRFCGAIFGQTSQRARKARGPAFWREMRATSRSMVGGLAMMVLAVVFLFAGLLFPLFALVSPILLLVGLVFFLKGAVKRLTGWGLGSILRRVFGAIAIVFGVAILGFTVYRVLTEGLDSRLARGAVRALAASIAFLIVGIRWVVAGTALRANR